MTILPDVEICDNVFIAAGALITKSITESGVWGGIPAKHIGDMDLLYQKRLKEYKPIADGKSEEEIRRILWERFNLRHDKGE